MTTKTKTHSPRYADVEAGAERAKPTVHQHAHEIQPYGKIAKLPIALDELVCAGSTDNLNQLLADNHDAQGYV